MRGQVDFFIYLSPGQLKIILEFLALVCLMGQSGFLIYMYISSFTCAYVCACLDLCVAHLMGQRGLLIYMFVGSFTCVYVCACLDLCVAHLHVSAYVSEFYLCVCMCVFQNIEAAHDLKIPRQSSASQDCIDSAQHHPASSLLLSSR